MLRVRKEVFQTALLFSPAIGSLLWLAFAAGLLFGRSAWCDRPDALSSSTVVGSNYFLESIFVHKHFGLFQDIQESFFSRQRDDVDEELDELTQEPSSSRKFQKKRRKPEKKKEVAFQPSSLWWELGYAYGNPTASAQQPPSVLVPVGSLGSQSLVGSLGWEALAEFEMSVGLEVDSLPSLDYRHGRITMRFEYFTPIGMSPARRALLAKLREDEREGDEKDARVYYMDHTDSSSHTAVTTRYLGGYRKKGAGAPRTDYSDDEDDDPESDAALRSQLQGTYPNLKVAAVINIDTHLLQSPTAQSINQVEFGPDLALDLNEDTRFHLLGFYSTYSASVQNFTAQLPVSPGNSVILPIASIAGFQPKFLTFPTFVFEEGVSRDFSKAWTGEFYTNQVFYALPGIGVGVGLAPMLIYTASSDWNIGVGADLLLGGPGTAVVGLLNLSYLF